MGPSTDTCGTPHDMWAGKELKLKISDFENSTQATHKQEWNLETQDKSLTTVFDSADMF